MGDPLLHYTSQERAFKIINGGQIFAFSYRTMNDSKEGLAGLPVVKQILRVNDSDECLSSFAQSLKYINDFVNPFIFSLSKKLDLLSQWRAYGNIALGFEVDKDVVKGTFKAHGHLIDCIYEEQEISEVMSSIGIDRWKMLFDSNPYSKHETCHMLPKNPVLP